MKPPTSTTFAVPLGIVLAAAVAMASCMTPGQSRSMRSQLGEIRQQVDTLHDQQSRNGSAIRAVAARADEPRKVPVAEWSRPDRVASGTRFVPESSATEEILLPEGKIHTPGVSVLQENSSVSAQALAEGLAITKESTVSRGIPPPRPGALYRRGYVLYHQGAFARAEEALGSFLLADPDSPHADNARYWIGECRYARGLYHEAIEAFREVLDRHPGGGKASHALYKIALSFERLGETGGMERALYDLLERFPESDVAPLARSRLGGA